MINILLKGVSSKVDSIEAKRIYFVNVLSLLCFVASVLVIVPYIYFDLYIFAGIGLIFSPLYFLCYYYNSTKKFKKARLFIFSAITINIFCLSMLFGGKINMIILYLPLVVILFFLFDKDQKKGLFVSIILVGLTSIFSLILNSLFVVSVISLNTHEIIFVNTIFNGISILGTVFLSYVFVVSSEDVLKTLSEKNQHLEIERDELVESTIKLNERAQEQVDLNELKTKLISIISHDVRQPINSVISVAEIMTSSNLTVAEMHHLGVKLRESSLNVYQMLDNLLTWSYSQMNGLHPTPKELDLNMLVKAEIEKLDHYIEKKELTIETNISAAHIIYFDPIMFEIVFRNIFNNALKFSPSTSTITVFSKPENGKMILYIKDQGIGISDELKKKLFLNDLSKSRYGTQNEKGAGIGLLLCKELMDANHSEIYVETTQAVGSTFVLKFPQQ